MFAPIRVGAAEVEDIGWREMRFYFSDLALECARLAVAVPIAFISPASPRRGRGGQGRHLINKKGRHRCDPELTESKGCFAAV